jgi:hypothetical protein
MTNGEKCCNPSCANIVTEIRKKDRQYKKYCSLSCRRLGVAANVRKTCLEKYGVTNGSKTQSSKDKRVETCIEKYGVANPSLVSAFLDKIVETNIEKYGTDKPQKLEKFQQKTKESNLKKFGTEKPQQLQSIKDKTKETCIEKYGVSAPQQDKEVRKKSIETCLEKYGVENAGNLEFVREKIKETSRRKYGVDSPNQDSTIHRKQDGNRFRNKEFIFPSGRVDLVQGYEPLALNQLMLDGYNENDILTETRDMPKVWYFEDNKNRRYFPDIFIPKDNLIIEVKSTYTFDMHKNCNLLKKQACINAGYNFKFMVFNGRHNLVNVADDK